MPTDITLGGRPPTPCEVKRRLLAALSEEVNLRGGRALLSLAHDGGPLLYVRAHSGTVIVVAAETPRGWAFVWPGGQSDAADPRLSARHLTAPRRMPRPPFRPARRAHLKAVA
ncbi:hypothetical protein HDA32_004536 [Spinactinospora alkalitolerans]|uniref:Uncharacterized protein n=1 Tax=Spinactinospora alkalitolerans TaxID=687207 RepID=A0A852TY08_9ACTN|nr:hypothetical protein [Spinactinospora alkalitolerans]NYE49416.1 hypothetical protein [Spinactinospora alkalitolerans]